jgi:hypothetical protein
MSKVQTKQQPATAPKTTTNTTGKTTVAKPAPAAKPALATTVKAVAKPAPVTEVKATIATSPTHIPKTTAKRTSPHVEGSKQLKDVLKGVDTLSPQGKAALMQKLKEDEEKRTLDHILKQAAELNNDELAVLRESVDSKKKRSRPSKLEGQPKDAKTAWNFFSAQEMPQLKEALKAENPDIKQPDVIKKLGEMWQKMSADEKAPFEELARQDKERQAPLIAAFKLEHPEAFDEKGKRIQSADDGASEEPSSVKTTKKRAKRTPKPKKEKDPNAPKRYINGYLFYTQYARKAGLYADVPKSEFKKVCGAAWKALSPEGKKPYNELAEADKKRYEEEKALYDQQHGVEAPTQHGVEAPTHAEAQGAEMEESSEVSSSSEEEEDE